MSHLKITCAVLAPLTGMAVSALAQPSAVQQFQNFQLSQPVLSDDRLRTGTNAPELYSGENADIGPQRILRLNPRPKYFDVTLDSQVFYTDNANFTLPPYNLGSFVYVNTAQAAFTPSALTLGPGQLAPALGVASQWYNYDEDQMQPFDFNAQTAFINGKYTLGQWQVGIGGSYTRLLSQPRYDQTYEEYLPTFGVQRLFVIREKLLLIVGDQLAYHFTRQPSVYGNQTDENNRFDQALNLSLSWQPVKKVFLQPFYRLQYSYYPENTARTDNRNDLLHSAGVTVAWYPQPNFTVRAFFSYNFKQTDDLYVAEFREINGGLGLSFDWKF